MPAEPIAKLVDVEIRGAIGFDAAVTSRKDDHLNRWPLARQVYSVAVDGPADWSARIGVYGEWGTGKTSVLRFVESMARRDGHIVAWFDPWEYGNKSDLWQAFVLAISTAAKANLGESAEVGGKKLKAGSGKVAGFLSRLSKAVPLEGASAVGEGLELLRSAFAFSQKDLDGLREVLDGNRVIVIIDDLDRTEAELVPEILFALKQVMDVRGFSFICGFDPQVVGKVLKSRHKGFGNGLKFLEKIIDYPVWLPAASDEGLKKIAEADAAMYCSFIPSAALRDALDLLPKNPRSIRQFVRLCALLKTQTERHGKDELNWPIILTANVIKVRFPMLDSSTLHSQVFYAEIGMLRATQSSTREGEKVDQEIAAHSEKCFSESGISDASGESKTLLQRAIRRICRHLDLWIGEDVEGVIYQSTLTERPKAVTRKEFVGLLKEWQDNESIAFIGSWIERHSDTQGFLITEVATSLVLLLVDVLERSLKDADGAFTNSERANNRAKALKLMALLEELVLRPVGFHPDLKDRDWIPVDPLLGELVPFAETKNVVHRLAWKSMAPMLKRLVSGWDGNLEILLDAVRSVRPNGRRRIEGPASTAFARELNALVDDRLSLQIIAGVQEVGFIGRIAWQQTGTREMRRLIENPASQLWTKHWAKLVAAFTKKLVTPAAQGNAYAFLEWIRYLLEKHNPGDDVIGKALAGDKKLMPALWRTATCRPILGQHAHRLRDIPSQAANLGVVLKLPIWWQPAIGKYLSVMDAQTPRKDASSDRPQESDNPGE